MFDPIETLQKVGLMAQLGVPMQKIVESHEFFFLDEYKESVSSFLYSPTLNYTTSFFMFYKVFESNPGKYWEDQVLHSFRGSWARLADFVRPVVEKNQRFMQLIIQANPEFATLVYPPTHFQMRPGVGEFQNVPLQFMPTILDRTSWYMASDIIEQREEMISSWEMVQELSAFLVTYRNKLVYSVNENAESSSWKRVGELILEKIAIFLEKNVPRSYDGLYASSDDEEQKKINIFESIICESFRVINHSFLVQNKNERNRTWYSMIDIYNQFAKIIDGTEIQFPRAVRPRADCAAALFQYDMSALDK